MSDYKYPTTEITVHLDDVFNNLDNLPVEDATITIPDSYVTYTGYNNVTIHDDTKPPTIKILGKLGDVIQFVVIPEMYNNKEVEFEYFTDIDLIEDSDGVAKNIDQYKIKQFTDKCTEKDITMSIKCFDKDGKEWTISWDPIIDVGDVPPPPPPNH